MSKGSTRVDAPDPYATAQADATYNRIDQFTPYGSLTFSGPYRNRADLTLNPAVADLENRRLLSDRYLLDTALSRQSDIMGGSLPSLTNNVNPTGLQGFFGLPENLQSGTDAPIDVPDVPDAIGFSDNAIPGSKGGPNSKPDIQRSMFNPTPQRGGPFGGTIGSMIDPETFGQLGSLDQLEPFDLDRGRVEQAVFDRTASLLRPQFDQDAERIEQRIANQGLDPTGEAARRLRSQFQRGRDDTYSRLADHAVISGGSEQSRVFGLADALADRKQASIGQLFNFADTLGQRDIQAQLQNANVAQANRATQFNELASLLGLQQVAQPGLNSFFAPANVDFVGATVLNQRAQTYNADRAAGVKGGVLGGAADLGSAFLAPPTGKGK